MDVEPPNGPDGAHRTIRQGRGRRRVRYRRHADQHQRIEDFRIETSSMPKRVVTPADGVRKNGDHRWLSRDVLTQVSHTESDVPRFILRCEPADCGSDRIGSIALEKPQQR